MTGSDPPTSEDKSGINQSNLNISVTYEDAKRLVNQGFSVFAIKPRDKVPAISSWKEFQQRMPTDQELHEWFDPEDKNIAIVCGRISGGLVVVDFDDPAILDFLVDGGIDKFSERTLVVKTRKGYHAYFRVSESLLQNRRFDNLKIDIKGEGGYVVAPPSIHREGTRYEFLNDKDVEFNEKFDEFLRVLEQKDYEFKYAKEVLPYWEPSKRNFLEVGLTVFLKAMERWDLNRIIDFMLGIKRIKPFPQDPQSESEIIARVKNAYEKEYNFKRFLSDDIGTDELLKTLERIAPQEKGEKEKSAEWLDKNGNVQRDIIINDVFRHFPRVISDEDTIYIWDGDRYSDQGREIIAKYIQNALPEISSRTVSDIVDSIGHITFLTREEFERMRLPNDLIPVRNGLLDWRTKTLNPHDPKYFYSKRLNVDYNPDARCPGFIKYLLSRFEGNYREFFKILEDLALIFFRDNRYQIVSIWMGESKDSSGLVSGEEGKTLTAEVIIGEKFLGSELYTRASLQSLAEKDTEFEALKDKMLHVASLDEAGHITNYSGLLEQLRDPYIEKPIKFKRGQLRWKNTAYNILIGNKFPKATANTKAFFRTIRKIIYWRKPIGDDWKYKDQIDEEEKSGILNLAVDIMNIITARGKPYGLNDLEHAMSEYREISDSLLMLVLQIFEKDPESKIEQTEALEYIIQEGEARELVMETLTKNRLTSLLKNNLGVTTERTTENKEVEDKNGNKTKIKIHKDFYKGIKERDPRSIKADFENSTQKQLLDTLGKAVLDYVLDIPKEQNIQISKFVLPLLYNIYIVKEDRQDLDIWIQELKTCLENPNNSISDCVSKSLETIKKMAPLDNQNPPEGLNKNPEITEQFNKILNEIKSKNITINEPLSKIDFEGERFLVRALEPHRPDDAMRELGFSFVNQSKDGALYEKPFNIQALQGGS